MNGFISGFDSVKITTASYIVRTLQEMVSSDPQIIVVAPGAEPASKQVQRTEDEGTVIPIFWVGLNGVLLRRSPVSSGLQVWFELRFPPCFFLCGRVQTLSGAPRRASIYHGQASLPFVEHLVAPRGCSGIPRKAPGGARDMAAARGALQPALPAQAGGGCALCPSRSWGQSPA